VAQPLPDLYAVHYVNERWCAVSRAPLGRGFERLAKNDAIDAEMIAWFGETFTPEAEPTHDPERAALDQLAPERIKLPNERNAKILYGANQAPTVSARIQDLYGVANSLTIGQGRVPLRIEVLAPNHRPIQITDDLTTFWQDSYPRIKQELQRKYPKHQWR
jgi:HrpA-like RNA helicase